ncbi:MAG: glycosyltransferase family 2 protein [Deferribacteraceae bacterium]|jgi:glycosyltransferase involved in cell wall biosynthesis|nr:glycosyltransferase family 2 protein [Deferribacteraceae bacterium]
MKSPVVSVVIPVYNRFLEIKDAVESVLRQINCGGKIEIIVVDDASDIFNPLVPYLPLITLIPLKENSGVSRARNIGAEKAKGDYIAFLDSDDLFLPHKLSRQLAAMSGGIMASHTNEHWFKRDRFINQSPKHARYGGNILSKIFDKCRISPSSFMIERKLFYDLGGFDESLRSLEDYEFFLRLANRVTIEYIREKLIIKRAVTQNSLSAQILHIESKRLAILENFVAKENLNLSDLKAAETEIERKRGIVSKNRRKH